MMNLTAHGRPVRAQATRVKHFASGRLTRITLLVVITLEDGHRVECEHTHGHRDQAAATKCATALVARLNRELEAAR